MQLEMWLWKKSSLSSNLQWARVGGGSCLCRREKGQIPPRRLRNGIRGGTLDFDQSEILAQQTGRAHVMLRVVAARQICWPVPARCLGVGIVSADQAECALMKLMVASLTTLRYISAS